MSAATTRRAWEVGFGLFIETENILFKDKKKRAKKSAAEVGCFGRLGDEIPSELERDLWGRI